MSAAWGVEPHNPTAAEFHDVLCRRFHAVGSGVPTCTQTDAMFRALGEAAGSFLEWLSPAQMKRRKPRHGGVLPLLAQEFQIGASLGSPAQADEVADEIPAGSQDSTLQTLAESLISIGHPRRQSVIDATAVDLLNWCTGGVFDGRTWTPAEQARWLVNEARTTFPDWTKVGGTCRLFDLFRGKFGATDRASRQAAAEKLERDMATPMFVREAWRIARTQLPEGCRLPKALLWERERTVERITPRELSELVMAWKRCPICADEGFLDGRFCGCAAGVEAAYQPVWRINFEDTFHRGRPRRYAREGSAEVRQ